jgi:SH3-like domain-containing protein
LLLVLVAAVAAAIHLAPAGDGVAVAASAAEPGGAAVGRSGLPIPRFVSLKARQVNVRVGPGEDYKVAWVFTRSELPVEVIQEFDNWRRIRDSDGQVGWVFHSLLSGKRTVVVAPWATDGPLPIRIAASPAAAVSAYLEPRVMASIDRCRSGWCRLNGEGFTGWIEQTQLWGVYPGEDVD